MNNSWDTVTWQSCFVLIGFSSFLDKLPIAHTLLRDSNVVQFQQSLFTAKVSYHTVIGYSATTSFDRVTEACNNEKRIKKTETAEQSRWMGVSCPPFTPEKSAISLFWSGFHSFWCGFTKFHSFEEWFFYSFTCKEYRCNMEWKQIGGPNLKNWQEHRCMSILCLSVCLFVFWQILYYSVSQ